MREIQDMTLNVSRGLGLLEKRLSERTTRFQEEILGLDGSDGALGMRMTAIPIGDEVRLARVCRRGNLVEQYQVPWHVVERQSERGHKRSSNHRSNLRHRSGDQYSVVLERSIAMLSGEGRVLWTTAKYIAMECLK